MLELEDSEISLHALLDCRNCLDVHFVSTDSCLNFETQGKDLSLHKTRLLRQDCAKSLG